MSTPSDDYIPDKRLMQFVSSVDQEDEQAKEDLCPTLLQVSQPVTRYRDETLLGRGGLKEVFRVFDEAVRQWVALARPRKDRGLRCYDLFIHEAWLIASLRHPNIIKVHDVGTDTDGRPFFTMDLKRGTSLEDLIRAKHSTTELLGIFLKVCDAVAYAHSEGVIHLDLKPENIQCDRFGEVLVCDWGNARSLKTEGEEEPASLPHQHPEHDRLVEQVRGTPGYMAPEQITDPDGAHDERTDVYALGCMLHSILCGEPPFTGEAKDILEQTAACEVTSLRERYPERSVSSSMEAVVLKALARDPEKRYRSAIELQEEVHQFLGGFSTAAESPGFWKEARLFLLRHQTSAWIAFAAVVMITVSSGLFVQRLGRQQLATEEEHTRANELMVEVDQLSSDYNALFDESAVTRKELAENLVRSANRVMVLGLFEHPTRAVNDAWRLVNMALALNPDCDNARWERYTLYCMQLNHQQALLDPRHHQPHNLPGLPRLVEAFPAFDFTKETRPNLDQLTKYFQQACSSEVKHTGHLERVFVFHQATLSNQPERVLAELKALIEYINGGPKVSNLTYEKESRTLTLKSDAERVQLAAWGEGSGNCLLRFLPVRHLKLQLSGNLNLKHLRNLNVETIDLRDCTKLKLDVDLNLPQLKQITIRPGQFSPGVLETRIRSTEDITIIDG